MEVDEKTVAKSDELNQNEGSEKMDMSTPDLTSLSEEKGTDMETSGLRVSFSMCVVENCALWVCTIVEYREILYFEPCNPS